MSEVISKEVMMVNTLWTRIYWLVCWICRILQCARF